MILIISKAGSHVNRDKIIASRVKINISRWYYQYYLSTTKKARSSDRAFFERVNKNCYCCFLRLVGLLGFLPGLFNFSFQFGDSYS